MQTVVEGKTQTFDGKRLKKAEKATL